MLLFRRKALLSDTVGFISDLPIQVMISSQKKSYHGFTYEIIIVVVIINTFCNQLVEAFHATLEEVVEADLLVVCGFS